MFEGMLSGFIVSMRWDMLLSTLLGVIGGVLIGMLPGLTSTMGVALLIPLTFSMRPEVGLAALGGVYCSSTYSGGITAILVNIPGTPSACVTLFDGHPMALKGEATRAISVVTIVSCIGGLISVIVLLFLSPPLAQLSLMFGSPEYFMLAIFGISIIASLSGESFEKGLISGTIGLFLSTVGMHPMTGFMRFSFGQAYLYNGIPLVAGLIGFFSIPEIFEMVSKKFEGYGKIASGYTGNPLRYIKETLRLKFLILRSAIIGVVVGIIPGAGTDIGAFLAYNEAKRASKVPEEFGKGAIEGVAASETANNAVTGGSLVPMLTLGVPGNAVTAVFLGGLLIHGLRPGVSLFVENATITYGFIFSLLFSNLFFVPVGFLAARYAVHLLRTPISILAPTIATLSVIGSIAIQGVFEDVWLMLGMGLLGYFMRRNNVSPAPMVLGLVLGTMCEGELTRSLAIVQGNILTFLFQIVTRPISLIILMLTILSLAQGTIREIRKSKKH